MFAEIHFAAMRALTRLFPTGQDFSDGVFVISPSEACGESGFTTRHVRGIERVFVGGDRLADKLLGAWHGVLILPQGSETRQIRFTHLAACVAKKKRIGWYVRCVWGSVCLFYWELPGVRH